MGHKIITEKDFWMCSSGAMPAQLQGTRKSNKKSSGEVYITVADTATSSWIDFGCTKNMLWAALLTAVAVVVVVALIVGTGGVAAIGLIGMMAIGAAAGVAGGVIAAVDGALKCGQKNATARTWDASKNNLLLTGTPGITGDRTMTCSIGGVVKFAPEIKSWTHALALGSFNYVTQLAGCALGGAAVGAGGFLASGLAGGSLAVAAPTFSSVLSNVAGSFTGIWGGSRALFGLNALANEHAYGNVQDAGDAGAVLVNGGIPEIGMGQRIFTGQAHPSDYLLFLYLLNIKVKEPAPPIKEQNSGGDKDGNNTSKEEGNKTPEEEGANGSKGQGETTTKPNEGGEANSYESSQPGDPPGTYRDSNGRLKDSQTHKFVKDPNAQVAEPTEPNPNNPNNTNRPSWRKSEIDAEQMYPGYDTQKSFIDGKEVPYGTEGSTRPDLYNTGHSVEVKNYDVTSNTGRRNLTNELNRQYTDRLQNLPPGTRQTAVIDVRGQNMSPEALVQLESSIQKSCPNLEVIFIQ
ncbi:hypothetical protein AAEU33_00225 [Chryseobacterium sp. Chry.R1]|uniref:hypothetical protein n=1 Tax=Chryseobacterium sp. Chry.R1 TaxID=3139392 RepID=UPI0031F87EDC